jgi:hypothetical protein
MELTDGDKRLSGGRLPLLVGVGAEGPSSSLQLVVVDLVFHHLDGIVNQESLVRLPNLFNLGVSL